MVKLPAPFASIPRHPLLYPSSSPIHPLPNLTASLNASLPAGLPRVSIWAKREDQASPNVCSGNKYRKLEYVIPEILSQKEKVTTLVTEGGVQSNHTVQVAAVAARLGLEAIVLLHKEVGGLATCGDPEAFLRGGNVQMCRLLGADVRFPAPASQADDPNRKDRADVPGGTQGRDEDAEYVQSCLRELRERGKRGYFIPSGASRHPLGGLGYARCAYEIEEQEDALPSTAESTSEPALRLGGSGIFDYIFVACGSGSTLAGLLAGFRQLRQGREQKTDERRTAHENRKVIGVLISPSRPLEDYHRPRITELTNAAASLIADPAAPVSISGKEIHLDGRFVGDGYGILDDQTMKEVIELLRKDAMIVDPVYTCKVIRGMVEHVRNGEISGSDNEVNILFMHTGGQTAWGAYA